MIVGPFPAPSEEKGAKKVLLRNLIETKFERILRPLAERILDPSQTGLLSAEAFLNRGIAKLRSGDSAEGNEESR